MGIADELQKLHSLREQGALTEDEFIRAKQRVLDGERAAQSPRAPAEARPVQSGLREFRRSTRDRWIGGVCGGLEDVTNVPSWTWRILFVLLALLHGVGLVLYILLWIFVPLQRPLLPAPAVIVPPPSSASTPPPPNG